MFESFKKILRPQPPAPAPAVPPGERVYAVGDIHGCRELFVTLLTAIDADDRARGAAHTTIVLLGDPIDRGPDSAGVIDDVRAAAMYWNLRILQGNHEEMFLRSFDSVDVLRNFLRYGGRETVLSYPLERADWDTASLEQAQAVMRACVPEADLEFIRGFEDRIAIGDYVFVHAGVRPGVALFNQSTSDLRWIREPFLSCPDDYGFVVVHGHTITEHPVIRANRIGIDTGAYASGRLTALGLEGTDRWLIGTRPVDDAFVCEQAVAC